MLIHIKLAPTPIHTEVTRTVQNNKSSLQSSLQWILLVTHGKLPTLLLHIKSGKAFSYAVESVCSIDLVTLSLFYGILASSKSGKQYSL
jgi:hypothetical protein